MQHTTPNVNIRVIEGSVYALVTLNGWFQGLYRVDELELAALEGAV